MRRLAILLLCAPLAACSSVQVSHDYDEAFDFSGYRTWHWLPRPVPEVIDPRIHNALVDQRVRGAVERTLGAKGYRKVADGQGDFGVGYHTAIEGKVDVQTIDSYYGYGPGWGGGRYAPTETYVREYDQGTLVLDVVDARTRHLVWRGSAQAEVYEARKPAERDSLVQEAVDEMLEKFPPR